MLDVLIVGAGPAGFSAAVYTGRAGLSTQVVTGDSVGGLLMTTDGIDNYLGMNGSTGAELAEKFQEHAEAFGAELVYDVVEEIAKTGDAFTVVLEGGDTILAKTVVYAAGSTPKKLGIKGEDTAGVSYCATCDGMFFKDKPVAVVGGGETAAEDALYLSQLCSTVDVYVRGNDWRASAPAVQKLVEKDNINIKMETSVDEIFEKDGKVSGAVLNDGSTVDLSAVFVAVGQLPNAVPAEPHVTLYSDGFVRHSTVDGFFVAGDICQPSHRQVAVAVGDGARAGIDATRYVLNSDS